MGLELNDHLVLAIVGIIAACWAFIKLSDAKADFTNKTYMRRHTEHQHQHPPKEK